MKLKDNAYRCPWCGNFIPTGNLKNFISYEKHCPFCDHHCNRKFGYSDILLALILCLIVIFSEIRAYILLPLTPCFIYAFEFFGFNTSYIKSTRSSENSYPTKGYKAKITPFSNRSKIKLMNDAVIPIVFVNKDGKAVSSVCCVRVESRKKTKQGDEFDLKLLEFGETPCEETTMIYLFNKGEIFASGTIISLIPVSY